MSKLQSRLSDASIFLGITSAPQGGEINFLRGMRSFFDSHRKSTESLFRKPDSPKEVEARARFGDFYGYAPYYLFGTFDMAFLMLMDDFEFGTQGFCPYDPKLLDTGVDFGFHHRSILGPCPAWKSKSHVVTLARRTFLRKKNPPPLIGICQIELNNSLLIGGGNNFLRCVSKAIEATFRAGPWFDPDPTRRRTHIILLDSYSWHEYTLLIFSDSYKDIMDLVMDIQNLTLGDMGKVLWMTPGAEKRNYREEWREYLKLQNIYCLLPRDHEGARISANLLKASEGPWPNYPHLAEPPFGSHVVFNTTTTLGFSALLLERTYLALDPHLREKPRSTDSVWWRVRDHRVKGQLDAARIKDEKKGDRIYLVRHWTKKAGHTDTAVAALNPMRGRKCGFAMSSGRRDFWFECKRGKRLGFEKVSSRDVVRRVLTSCLDIRRWAAAHSETGETGAGVLGVVSTLGFHMPSIPSKRAELLGHASADQFRKLFTLNLEQIDSLLQCCLRPLRVPKVTAEALLNAVTLYNQGVEDNFLFSSFLELGPYVRRIWERLLVHSRRFSTADDFKSRGPLGGMAARLKSVDKNPVTTWLVSQLSRRTKHLLQEYHEASMCAPELRGALSADFNRLLPSRLLLKYLRELFNQRGSGQATEQGLLAEVERLSSLDVVVWNHVLLMRHYMNRQVEETPECKAEAKRDSEGLALSRLSDGLSRMVDNFETGWRNRYHGGWGLGDVSDFNLEFKGGIQQLATAFDGAYKRLSWHFTGDARTLAIITASSGIHTIAGAVELNFFDIFKPEFFAARAAHEAGETLLHIPPVGGDPDQLRSELREKDQKSLLGIQDLVAGLKRERARKEDKEQFEKTMKSVLRDAYPNACPQHLERIVTPDAGPYLLFDQTYADMCNFNTVFLRDKDLYSFWWLASFVTDPINWQTDGKVVELQAREALLRTFLVMLETTPDSEVDGISTTIKKYWRFLGPYLAPSTIRGRKAMLSYGEEVVSEVFKWAEKLHGVPKVKSWFRDAISLGESGLPVSERQKEILDSSRYVLPRPHVSAPRELGFDFLKRYATPRSDYAYKALKDGKGYTGGQHRSYSFFNPLKTPYPFEADRWYDFCDTVALMNGYLRLLKDESKCDKYKDTARDPILERAEDGSPKPIDPGCPELLFDPRGGTFTTSASFRRKYLMWRCAFVMSLLDISEKAKLVQCREHLWHNPSVDR